MVRTSARLGRAFIIAVTVTVSLVLVSPALAEPKGIFKVFKECPTEIPGIALCNFTQVTSGEFSIGTVKVPIDKTIIIQGGDLKTGNPENPREFFALPAKNGESMSMTELDVPGGLLGFVKCEEVKGKGFRKLCKQAVESLTKNHLTRVTATMEPVDNAKTPVIFNEFAFGREAGAALTLPLRVHLKNPFLGKSCYIGSESNPLVLHLTDGETHPPTGFKPLHGAFGEPETLEEKEQVMARITGSSLVDNTFSAPGAEGCGNFFFGKDFLDPFINEKFRIPNKAGENAVVLNGELNAAGPEAVIASEKF
jgi:hypothetical protein